MTSSNFRVSRRAVLRGVGVAMATPWLESIPVWGDEPAADGVSRQTFPKRFAALFMGNGISPNRWWAKGAGAEMELSQTLQPMEPFKNKLNVITGLFNKHATGVGIHPGQTGNILSGAALQKGAVLKGGVSVDQLLADRFADETPQPSIVLGCEQPITGYHETNFSMAYSSHISWQDANSPVPMEVYPSLAFDSLFDNQGSRRTKSILDRVKEDAAHLNREVSRADQRKLDEYLTSVREVEKRIEPDAGHEGQGRRPGRAKGPTGNHHAPPRQRAAGRHSRAHAADVATSSPSPSRPTRRGWRRCFCAAICRDCSIRSSTSACSHHAASHDDNSDAYERVARYYVSQLAYLASRLEAMPEGDRTVLDNSCLLFLSNLWSGTQHDSGKVPLLTVGGLGGTFATGRVLDYVDKGDENRKLCSLYLALLEKMDAKQAKFGDATAPLAGL